MKLPILLAIISGLLLALFLWLRPVIGEIGEPTMPDVRGRASSLAPEVPVTGVAPASGAGASGALAATQPSPGDAAKYGITHLDEVEQQVLALVNEERAKQGIAAVQAEETLRETARHHSDDMIVRDFFSHDNPDGWSAADRIAARHRRLIGLTGENIWKESHTDISDRMRVARELMLGWMSSPGHKANILKPDYTHLGVGVSVKERQLLATQNFAAIRAQTDQPLPPQIRGGESLNLATNPPAEKYDFFSPDKGDRVGDARAITDGAAKVPAGVYKLRFYYPRDGGHVIYWGPRIEVK